MGKVKRMLYEEQEHDEFMRDQEPDYDEYTYPISNCCGAEIVNTDICSECKEHCEPHEWEDDDLTPEEMNAELRQLGF